MRRRPLHLTLPHRGLPNRAAVRGMRRALARVAIVTTIAALAACAPIESGTAPSGAPGATPAPASSTPPPAPLGEAQSSGEPSALTGRSIPLDIACDALVDGATIYDLNPNFGADPAPRPSALAAQVVDNDGVSCGWINQTSGTPLTASVAAFDAAGWQATRDAAAARGGSAVGSGLGGEGVFRAEQSVGVIELFRSPYWILVESPVFASAEEAELVIDAMVRALP